MRLVILTSQVSHYHNARFVGATNDFKDLHVISAANAGDFPEFLAGSFGEYTLHRLYDGRQEYASAVATGELTSRIKKALSCIRPEVIAVAGWATPESLASLAYGRRNGVPTVVFSESQADDASRSFLRETVKRRLVSQFDAGLVGGPSHGAYLELLGIPPNRIHFGYNAVDNAYFERQALRARDRDAELRHRHKLPKRYLLASARFIDKKNLQNLVQAYADARGRRNELPDLVILGDGPERAAIESVIRVSQSKHSVHLFGFRGYDVLPIFYALSEAFLHVSAVEQWGLVINEAMACGTPVVASRPCGAARTLVRDGVNGVLTGVDVASISNAIVRIFDMTPVQRDEMARAGALSIKDWGPERFCSGLKAAVESACGAPKRDGIWPWDRVILEGLQRRMIETVA